MMFFCEKAIPISKQFLNDERMNLKGLGVAVLTPFTSEGQVDYKAIPAIIENITSGRADYLVLMGTTAESPCLTQTTADGSKREREGRDEGRKRY